MQTVYHINVNVCSKFSYSLRSELFHNLTQFRSHSPLTGEPLLYIYRSSHVGRMKIKLHTHSAEIAILMQVFGLLAREIILSTIALALIT